MARPPSAPDLQRRSKFALRLTPEERACLTARARAAGQTAAAFLRAAFMTEASRTVVRADPETLATLRAAVHALRPIGANLNQLTRSFHVHRDLPPGVLREELTALTRERAQVEALVLRLMDIT